MVSTHVHLPRSLIQCFSHMDVLAKLLYLLACSRLREHNKICVDVDTYMGVTLSELLDNISLVFNVST